MGKGTIGSAQRLKILYLYKILLDYTDEDHALSMPAIIEMLESKGISAARKALYEDIEALKLYGLDIIYENGKKGGYKVVSRDFELPELKLLADAVSSSRFLTEKKSAQLIKKLDKLSGVYQAKQLERQLYVSNRVKSFNELIYLNVDAINSAVSAHKKISFKYFDYDIQKKKKYRDGVRVCSPYALTWEDERYYLIAYYEKYEGISNFRVDRMENVQVLDEKAEPYPEGFNLTDYLNSSFSMFSGTSQPVKLRFHSSLVNAVIDRFGKDTVIAPDYSDKTKTAESFTITVQVKTDCPEPFFGWLFQFGTKVQILSPASLNKRYKEMLKSVLNEK